MVIVAHHHQAVAGVEFLLAPEDASADLLVEVVGPLVGSRDDDDVLITMAVVQVVEQFGQVIPSDDVQVGKGFCAELGQWSLHIFGQVFGQRNVLSKGMGVGEDAAVELLTHHVVEGALGQG